MKASGYSVAVVGATGLVGSEILAALEQRQFPFGALQLYASIRSAGDEVSCGGVTARVEMIERARFADADFVFFAAGEQVSAEWIERATESGAIAIDTSPLLAGDPEVPVVVPEVNAADLSAYTNRNIIVSPTASAVALAVGLKPLQEAAGIVRVVGSTFEPVSGAGHAGIEELQQQVVELINGRSAANAVFTHRIAFNILPQVGEFLAGGRARGESHVVLAMRRLLSDPSLPVSITCTRVPVFYGEALAVNVETSTKLTADEARDILRAAPGVLLQDDLETFAYPTAAEAVGQDATLIGRIREDESLNVLDLWMAIDNLRKGAAVNAVQIAEVLIRDYL
jgi:aspartate-semialdehyde dehydrogenase